MFNQDSLSVRQRERIYQLSIPVLYNIYIRCFIFISIFWVKLKVIIFFQIVFLLNKQSKYKVKLPQQIWKSVVKFV